LQNASAAGARTGRCEAEALILRRLVILFAAGFLAGQDLFGDETGILADRRLDLGGDVGNGLEKYLGFLAALADALAVVGEPGARLLHAARLHAQVDELAHLRDALAVHDVELDLLERWRQLVLHHLDAGLVADHFVALLDRANSADVEPHRGVELERVPARGG